MFTYDAPRDRLPVRGYFKPGNRLRDRPFVRLKFRGLGFDIVTCSDCTAFNHIISSFIRKYHLDKYIVKYFFCKAVMILCLSMIIYYHHDAEIR